MASCGVLNARNWLMSVPEANALSPAPVKIRTLMARSWFAFSQISARRSYIWKVKALRACGRLKVTRPTPSRTSKRISIWSVMVCSLVETVFDEAARPVKLEIECRQGAQVLHHRRRREFRIFLRHVCAIDPDAAEAERARAHHVPAVRRHERHVGGRGAEGVGHHGIDLAARLVDADRVDRQHG